MMVATNISSFWKHVSEIEILGNEIFDSGPVSLNKNTLLHDSVP